MEQATTSDDCHKNELAHLIEQRRNKTLSPFTLISTDGTCKVAGPDSESVISDTVDTDVCEDSCGIKLTRLNYYTIPNLEEMHKYKNEKGECLVKGFTIGHYEYGKVFFNEQMDICNLDLDAIVEFAFREVTIYPDDSLKPPIGQGLNRPAEITLNDVWPRDRITHEIIKDPIEIEKNDFISRLVLLSEKQNATFINYFPDSGEWIFAVEHFTKFAFSTEDDEKLAVELKNEKSKLNVNSFQEEKNEDSIATPSVKSLQEEIYEDNIAVSSLIRRQDSDAFTLLKTVFFKEKCTFENHSEGGDGSLIPNRYPNDSTKLRFRIKPKHYTILNRQLLVPLQRSLLISRSHSCMDMEIFKKKSYKVGWGLRQTFCILNAAVHTNLPENKSSVIQMQIRNVSIPMNLEEHLEAVFEESTVTVDEAGIPLFTVNKNNKSLVQHDKISLRNMQDAKDISYQTRVWNLCCAFWGPNAISPTSRRSLFSKWLEECVILKKEDSCESSPSEINIFNKLIEHKIKEAAEFAMNSEFPQLSLLLCQADTNNIFKEIIRYQMEQWFSNGSCKMINKDILKIYYLLGGVKGFSDVNVFDQLDWKCVVSVHLWYLTSVGTSLINALHLYEKNMNSLDCINLPKPDYSEAAFEDFDILYNIMVLFKNPILDIKKVLNPISYTKNQLDYSLSWFLLQVFAALRIGSISEEVENAFHLNFASHLENVGLWKWSIFVCLFIKDKSVKKNIIQSTLDRNLGLCNIYNSELYQFLINNLRLPPEWIYSSFIRKSDLLKENLQIYKYCIFIHHWTQAHEIAINLLIPELVLMEQFESLFHLLKLLVPGKKDVLKWHTQAGLILEILKLYNGVYYIENSDIRQLLVLKRNVVELCCRIKDFPIITPKHSFAISKFSKFIVTLLKLLYCELLMKGAVVPDFTGLMRTLVMPLDYKYDELMNWCLIFPKMNTI